MLAAKTGAQLRFIEVDAEGRYILDDLETTCSTARSSSRSRTSATPLGTIAPLETIVPRAHAAGAVVLIDGAQSVPHMPVDVRALDVDFFAASGHKMCGPTGIGFLYGKRELLEAMPPFLTGGDMIRSVSYEETSFNELPWKFEAGTSNIADAIALGAAVDYLDGRGHGLGPRPRARPDGVCARARWRELEPRGLVIYGPQDLAQRAGVISFNLGDVHAARRGLDPGHRRRLRPRGASLHDAADGAHGLAGNRPGLLLPLQHRADVDALMAGLRKAAARLQARR